MPEQTPKAPEGRGPRMGSRQRSMPKQTPPERGARYGFCNETALQSFFSILAFFFNSSMYA